MAGRNTSWERMLAVAAVPLLFLAAAFAEDDEISERGLKFSQTSITIKSGTPLRYVNRDDVTHHIMVIDRNRKVADEGLQKSGDTKTRLFDEAGLFEVRCAIHPRMKMTVRVEE